MSRQVLPIALLVAFITMFTITIANAQGPILTPPKIKTPTTLAGTAFTYQGQLKNNGTPVNGTCDFRFGLWDDSTIGNQVGTTQTVNSLVVMNGLFTTPINFGDGVSSQFTGDARWLAIRVRCPSGTGVFETLDPRQAMTPAPVAFSLPGLYTQQNSTSPNIIGGYSSNTVDGGAVGSTIGGGGEYGYVNHISNSFDVIGGGLSNTTSNVYATIGGGYTNNASGPSSTIPGGANNVASGAFSFAAGYQAQALHQGAFVWGDSTNAAFSSTNNNQFLIRANGGVGINTNSPGDQLEIYHVDSTVRIRNSNDTGGAFVGNTYNSLQLGMYDPTGSTWSSIPPNTKTSLFGVDNTGKVGSLTNTFPGSPAFRNLLDDGTGTARFSGDIITTGNIAANLGLISAHRVATDGNGGFNGPCMKSDPGSGWIWCNQDLAEAFGTNEPTHPGDLVALVTKDVDKPTVKKSAQANDNLLIGVISTDPGLVFDNGKTYLGGDNSHLDTAGKAIVALVGRVPVNVSMENGSIAIGDPLTSSSKPGVAMKATSPSKIIDYAIENANQEGQVLALIQPGYYLPADQLQLAQKNADLEARIAALEKVVNATSHGDAGSIPTTWVLVSGLIIAGLVTVRRRR